MTRSNSSKRGLALGTAGLLLTAVLGACNSGTAPTATPSDVGTGDASDAAAAALPLSTTTPATVSSAPPVTALPVAAAVPVRHLSNRRQGYAYLDRAYYQEDAVENAPPDYTFDDDGVRPWTWSTRDGSRVISEPVAGGYRYYYYQAGADSPYLVRDPHYSYAYDNGALVDVFSASGQEIDPNSSPEQVGYAGRYLGRGQGLYRRASSDQHVPVNAHVWSDRRDDIAAQRAAWHQQIGNNPDWSAWNNEHHDDEQRVWNDDREQHQAAAQQFGQWQQQGYQGQPPQLYQQSNGNHTAAIVGGVVAAGVAAVAIHELTSHHDHPNQPQNQPQNPGMAPQNNAGHPGNPAAGQAAGEHNGQGHMQPTHGTAPQNPGMAPQNNGAHPGNPAAGHEHPGYGATQPTHPGVPQGHEGPAAQPGRPEHMMAPHNTQPAPHYAAPQAVPHPAAQVRTEVHTATTPVGHVTEVQHTVVHQEANAEPHPAPAPQHVAGPPAAHAAGAHPGPQDHDHEHHEHP